MLLQMKLSRYSYDEFFNRVKSGDAIKTGDCD